MRLNLRRNSIWAMVETVCATLILFLLYRLVVAELGIRELGIWSLVTATTSVMRLADAGAAASLGRLIAVIREDREPGRIRNYIDTAILTNLSLYTGLTLVLYWPTHFYLSKIVSDGWALEQARSLLPYAFASFILSNVTAATVGALVGLQRSDLKSAVMIASLGIQLVASWALISTHQLVGLAQAQILQNLFGILVGSILIGRVLYNRTIPIFPKNWMPQAFRELLGFGIKLQATTAIISLYDPLTKLLVSTFGGLEATGLFEIANRIIYQTRSIVTAPAQVLVPAFALLKDESTHRMKELYLQSIALTAAFGVPALIGIALLSPAVSILFVGSVNGQLVAFTLLLVAGWCINLLSVPAFFLGVGTGEIRWNTVGSLVITGGALALGTVLGKSFGASGVVAASGIALSAGSLLIIVMNCRAYGLRPFASLKEVVSTVRSKLIGAAA